MSDVFNIYAAKNQNQKTLELLTRAFPDNEELQDSIGNLLETKELWKKRLTKTWLGRKRPVYTQWMVRDINFLFKQMVGAEKHSGKHKILGNITKVESKAGSLKKEPAAGVGGVRSQIST